MIVYDNRDGFLFVRVAGSALYNIRTVLPGVFSGGIAALTSNVPEVTEFLKIELQSPTVYFNGVAFLISFVVVFRSQLAYGRFFSSLNSYHRMKARLTDLAVQTKALCESNDHRAVLVKEQIFRWVRLYHKLALTRLRGGYVEDMYLRNLITEDELETLIVCRDRTQIVTSWIVRAISSNLSSFTAPPPIVGRLFQLASDADLEFGGSLMVAETPFPFPYAQITGVLLWVWACITPLFVARYVENSAPFTVGLSFLSTWIIFAVNESAQQLESPFDGDDNDVPLTYFDVTFDSVIENVQFTPEPSFFKVQSKCYSGKVNERRAKRLSRRIDRAADLVAAAKLEAEAASPDDPVEALEPPKLGDIAEESQVDVTVENNGKRPSNEGRQVSMNSTNTLSTDDDDDHQFVPEEVALTLFRISVTTTSRPLREVICPRWLCHNPVSRLFAKSRRSLREVITERVDASTMRAQGAFKKYR